jgi:hypothetical protein
MVARRAFGAGVLGAAVMSVLMAVSRGLGFPVKLELVLGSYITGSTDARGWVVGFLAHFAIGGLFGIVYALGFGRGMRHAGVLPGLALGALHALAAGLVLVALPRVHPLIPDEIVAPGPFMANLGLMGVISFVGLHLLFGAIVGELCKPLEEGHDRFGAGRPLRR